MKENCCLLLSCLTEILQTFRANRPRSRNATNEAAKEWLFLSTDDSSYLRTLLIIKWYVGWEYQGSKLQLKWARYVTRTQEPWWQFFCLTTSSFSSSTSSFSRTIPQWPHYTTGRFITPTELIHVQVDWWIPFTTKYNFARTSWFSRISRRGDIANLLAFKDQGYLDMMTWWNKSQWGGKRNVRGVVAANAGACMHRCLLYSSSKYTIVNQSHMKVLMLNSSPRMTPSFPQIDIS